MSAEETARKVIAGHNLVSIATVDSAGTPCVRSVDYAVDDDGKTLYAITQKDSRKVGQIQGNGNVAFSIDHDCPVWEELRKLKYIKGTATAAVVADPEETQKAFGHTETVSF